MRTGRQLSVRLVAATHRTPGQSAASTGLRSRAARPPSPLPSRAARSGPTPALRVHPESSGRNNAAVIAPARLAIAVVPVVRCSDALAVLALPSQPEIDQEPRQSATQPRPPGVRVRSVPVSHCPHPSQVCRGATRESAHRTQRAPTCECRRVSSRARVQSVRRGDDKTCGEHRHRGSRARNMAQLRKDWCERHR
jgi:hypothetical protein